MVDKTSIHEVAFILMALFTVVAALIFFVGMLTAPMITDYQYDVKMQQVQDARDVQPSDVTQFSEIEHGSVLHRAFKEADHFFGSASVDLDPDEQLETFTGWKTVEINGVYVLVSVEDDFRYYADPMHPFLSGGLILLVLALVMCAISKITEPDHFRY